MEGEVNITPEQREAAIMASLRRIECAKSHLYFTRKFFKVRENSSFLVNWHHVYIAELIEKVFTGEIKNLVLCVPPGASKTEMAVINVIGRGLAQSEWCRFLHVSSQDDLVQTNSQKARDLVTSPEFQELWPMRLATDSSASKRWNVMVGDKKAGGVYAVALGGQITGFRAGYMRAGFSGAILGDDLLKADDAYSAPAKKKANRRWATLVKTRKAHPDVPVILIMQRLATDDPVGFMKGGNVPGEYTYIDIPALIDDAYVATLPPHIQKLVVKGETDDKGRFSYWPYKERLAELLQLESAGGMDAEGNRISRFMFAAQYMQKPILLGGNIIKTEKFVRYVTPPKIKWRKVYGDTAQKTKESNDFSVLACWGMGEDGKAYLLDLARGRWEAPELKRRTIDFWNKQKAADPDKFGFLRKLAIEDKASGTGLIQQIKSEGQIPVEAVPREKDKLTRVMDIVSYIDAGMACVPQDAAYMHAFMEEHEGFTADDTHPFDDQVDTTADALIDILGRNNTLKTWENLI